MYEELTYDQKQTLYGTLLGDGCIFKDKNAIRYRFNMAHGLKQEDYFLMKYNDLKSVLGTDYKYQQQHDKRTNKVYKYIKVQSLTTDLFTSLRKEIYNGDGKKRITKEFASKLDEKAIAVLYFDEGYKESHCGAVNISLDDFDRQSALNLKERIEKVFDIETTVTTRLGLRVPTKHGRKFKEAIKKYASPSVLYKLI